MKYLIKGVHKPKNLTKHLMPAFDTSQYSMQCTHYSQYTAHTQV